MRAPHFGQLLPTELAQLTAQRVLPRLETKLNLGIQTRFA